MYYYPFYQYFCFILVYNIKLRMLVLRHVFYSMAPARYMLKHFRFCMNSEINAVGDGLSIFDSKYHLLGPLELRRPKAIQRLLGQNQVKMDVRIAEIEKHRLKLKGLGVGIASTEQYRKMDKKPEIQEYLKHYSELSSLFGQSTLNNQWIYKAIGWYNFLHLYKPLVQRLLGSKGEETLHLLDSLDWMTYRWRGAYGMMDEQLRQKKQVQTFYKNFSQKLEINYLRKVESIIMAPLVYSKKIYYENYVAQNLERLLKSLQWHDSKQVSNIIWLFHQMVSSMIDQEYLVSKFQRFLFTSGLQLGESAQLLLKLYEMKGRVKQSIYLQHLKPYLLKHKMKQIGDIIQTIKFVICSECGDNALMKNLYEVLDMKYQKGCIKHSRHLYDLHLYTHYLRIKGYKIKLNPDFQKQLTSFCKERGEDRQSLSRLVFDLHTAQKGKVKTKHINECLNVRKSILSEYPTTKRSAFEASFKYKLLHLKLEQLNIHEKPMFCCFQLDFCLHKPGTNQLLDVEIQGMQYVFSSGRMVRKKEIRDEILKHYGFKVIHVDYNNYKGKQRVTEDVILMNKRLTPHQNR